jgi:hypothetical protein
VQPCVRSDRPECEATEASRMVRLLRGIASNIISVRVGMNEHSACTQTSVAPPCRSAEAFAKSDPVSLDTQLFHNGEPRRPIWNRNLGGHPQSHPASQSRQMSWNAGARNGRLNWCYGSYVVSSSIPCPARAKYPRMNCRNGNGLSWRLAAAGSNFRAMPRIASCRGPVRS